jgi:hypothetical protein
MKSSLEYEYRPNTTKDIVRMLAASGVLGLIAICGGAVQLGPPTSDPSAPRTVSLGTLAVEEAAGREATSALGSCFGLVVVVLCATFAVYLGYGGVSMGLNRKQRIALLPKGIRLPLATKSIEYGRISSVAVMNTNQAGARHLQVDYDKDKRSILYESGLLSSGAFDEIHAVLKRRTEAAAGSRGG